MTPFLYVTYEEIYTGGGRSSHNAAVRCANQGYGHRQDPILLMLKNFNSKHDVKKAVREYASSLDPTTEILLTPEDYLGRMVECQIAKATAVSEEFLEGFKQP